MHNFKSLEKRIQEQFKLYSGNFTQSALVDGDYKGNKNPFRIPFEHAQKNLFQDIRNSAKTYFKEIGIKWHDGKGDKPCIKSCVSKVVGAIRFSSLIRGVKYV